MDKPLALVPGAEVLRLNGFTGTFRHPPIILVKLVHRPEEPLGETWEAEGGLVFKILPGSLVRLRNQDFWYRWYLKHNGST